MTTMKSMILAGALALSSMTLASAKTYNVRLNENTSAGTLELKAGDYRLNVEGQVATFTNVETNRSILLLVRVANGPETFDHTAIGTKSVDGVQRMESIELENSNNKLEF